MCLIARWMKPLETWEETNRVHRIRGTSPSSGVGEGVLSHHDTKDASGSPAKCYDFQSRSWRCSMSSQTGSSRPGWTEFYQAHSFVSWIHEVDFIKAVEFLIASPTVSGPINLTSPHPLPNSQFLRILRKAWGARFGVPTPPWMLEIGTAPAPHRIRAGSEEPPRCSGSTT